LKHNSNQRNKNASLFKMVGNFLFVYLCLVLFFVLSLTLVSLIPGTKIKENIASSALTLKEQGDRPRILGNHKLNQLDNLTESVMLGIIYNIDEHQPLKSALKAMFYAGSNSNEENYRVNSLYDQIQYAFRPNNQYPRYWHGYIVAIRPMLTFMPYSSVQKTLQIAFLIFFGYLVALFSKKLSMLAALSFAISIVLVNISIIPVTVHASMVFFICFSAIALFLKTKDMSTEKYIIAFFIIGALTSFVDLLTAPFITFGFPAIVLLISRNTVETRNSFKSVFSFVVYIGLSWMIGYALLWGTKWVLASIMLKENVIAEGINGILERIGRDIPFGNIQHINSFDAIKKNLQTFYTFTISNYPISFVVIPLMIFYGFFAVIWHKKKYRLDTTIIIALIGLLPFFWFGVAANHSFIHAYFTSRILSVSVFAFSYVLIDIVDWNQIKKAYTALKSKMSSNRKSLIGMFFRKHKEILL